ncbi:MAG: prolipoprotein diacylglyceryl transferase family protein [Solirubrobacteraceae bacterium]
MLPEIGPIKTFGIMFALAFVGVGVMVYRRFRELGKPVDWAYEVVFFALIGGLVGARAYYLIQHPSEFGLSGIFGGSGLVFYGGAVGGAAGAIIWAWWRGMLNGYLLDMGGIGLAIGYSIGRIGCQLSGDGDYGTPSSLPWAMAYPDGTVPTTQEVHPTPIYETLAMGFVAWLLWRWRDRFQPGTLMGFYLIFAGIERFLVEFIRRNSDVAAGLTAAQFESIAFVILGAIVLAVIGRRHGGILLEGGRPRPAT